MKIYLEEKWLIKYYVIKHLTLLKIQNNVYQKELAEELPKPIIRKLEKSKVYSYFIDNIWSADVAVMELIIKFNEGFQFFLCVIGIYSKKARAVPLKDKKVTTITNAFQKNLDNSSRKPNKIWTDKESEVYNGSIKSWLQDNDIEICSTHNEGKSVNSEKFMSTLKKNIYKYKTSVSKMCFLIT